MNLADQQHLATAEAGTSKNVEQSLASTDNPQTCAKSKTRATPRRIPGLSKTNERGYLNDDRELLGGLKKPGSLYAALMLGQLRRDFAPDKDGKPAFAQRIHEGHYWVAYSLTYWERQLGLTENEARSGVQCLADSNGVVKVGKFKFGNEPKYQHFRLTEKALGYVPATPVAGIEEGGCVATTQGVCGNHTATTPTVFAPTVVFEVQKQSPVPDETPASPESTQEQAGEIQTPKPILAILDEYTGHEALKASPDYWRYGLWVSLLEKHGHPVPSYVKPKRMREYLSMLQRLDYRVTGHGEDTFADMLDCLLGGWDAWRCAFSGHGYDAPVTPTIAFLTKYAMRAYGWDTDDEATEQPEQVANQPTTPLADSTVCVAVPEVVEPVTQAAVCPPVAPVDEYGSRSCRTPRQRQR